ncbi:MAG: 4-hydroxy-3-methylbut-2-enyl diphosphate reductase [Caulobacteraceae bacterium]
MNVSVRPPLQIRLASPRGFCAGVDRAIQIVERALQKFGAPVYVRNQIVHNTHVVERLSGMGAVFVESLDECPSDRPVIFSAHGVPRDVPAEANRRQMIVFDATCPLVSKVHVEAQRHYEAGREVVLIGHAGHPEVVGTMGQLPAGAITLIQTMADVASFAPQDASNVAFVTQTTLSLDDTAEIVGALKARFPGIATPHREDICYATTNRQEAVKQLAEACDLVLVVGSRRSSNSVRLVEVALKSGARDAKLIDNAGELDFAWLEGVTTLGVTAGASAPEILVEGVLDALAQRFDITIAEEGGVAETVTFKLPAPLRT